MIEPTHRIFPAGLQTKTLNLSKGEFLFDQGDVITNIYFIESGSIELTRNTIEGSPVVLHIGFSGESIAEASLFSTSYHCSAIASVPSRVSFVKKKDFLRLLQNQPQETLKLLAIFSKQIRELRSINEIKNIRSANERILSYLKNNVNDEKKLLLDVSLKTIAHKVGLTHETFYRELKKLEATGNISRHTDYIILL